MASHPDPRWQSITGGISPAGQAQPMTQERLEQLAEEWATIVADIPRFAGSELLEKARSHVVHSWWDYELMVTACLVGFQAVEATFKQILYAEADEKTPFRHLVDKAERDSWFSKEKADIIRAGVELRNRLSHPQGRSAFTVEMTDSILQVCHLVVRDICSMKGLTTPSAPPANSMRDPRAGAPAVESS